MNIPYMIYQAERTRTAAEQRAEDSALASRLTRPAASLPPTRGTANTSAIHRYMRVYSASGISLKDHRRERTRGSSDAGGGRRPRRAPESRPQPPRRNKSQPGVFTFGLLTRIQICRLCRVFLSSI
jgi:hypothetical protein